MRRLACSKIAMTAGLAVCWFAFWSSMNWAGEAAGQEGEYLGPVALAAAPDGRSLYVACADSRQVLWVEPAGGEVVRRVAVEGEPTGIVLSSDGTRLLVTCAGPCSQVAVIEAASGRRLASIPAGHTAMSPVLSPDGRRLYVCNRFDNDLSVIDLQDCRELRRVPVVREPIAAAVTPDGRTVLVANHLPNMRTNVTLTEEVTPVVTLIDADGYATTAIELPSGSHSLRGLCVSPDGAFAFVTHILSNFQETPFRVDTGWINTNVVSIIDVPRRRLVSTIGLDEMDRGAANPWGVVCSSDGQWVGVSVSGTHELSVIGRSELLSDHARRTMSPMMGVWPIYLSLGASLWQRIKLPGQGPRGLAAAGTKLYVAEYFSDSVAEIDLGAVGRPRPRSIPLGPRPRLTSRRLGQLLFNDGTICYQQWQSCASCHPDGRTDALNWDLLNDGAGNPKNTKSLVLAHRTPPVMATGVRKSAGQAVLAGLVNILFSDRIEKEAAAISAYLASLRPVPSPRLIAGRLSPAAERGRRLFFSRRIGCYRCHPPPLYTDLRMHEVGTRGRYEPADQRFDTPTLIETWRTAPYLHDGRYLTVQQLLINGRHGLNRHRPMPLTRQQIDELAEFVLSL